MEQPLVFGDVDYHAVNLVNLLKKTASDGRKRASMDELIALSTDSYSQMRLHLYLEELHQTTEHHSLFTVDENGILLSDHALRLFNNAELLFVFSSTPQMLFSKDQIIEMFLDIEQELTKTLNTPAAKLDLTYEERCDFEGRCVEWLLLRSENMVMDSTLSPDLVAKQVEPYFARTTDATDPRGEPVADLVVDPNDQAHMATLRTNLTVAIETLATKTPCEAMP